MVNSLELFSLKGKTAIVTGAAGLIGREHCRALAAAGANVVAVDLDLEKCRDLADSLPTESAGFSCDITNPESIKQLLDNTLALFGKVDILVNNAAINDMVEKGQDSPELSKFENYPLDLFRKVMDVNVTGTFLCSQIIGKTMAERGSGSIINIASTYGVVAPNQSLYINDKNEQAFYKSPAYPAAKGAVLQFTRFLAAYWGRSGVRVNALSPGGVENGQQQYFIDKYSERTPLGRMANATDYMGAIVFLAGDASAYMTGANLIVDGGWVIW